MTTGTGLLIAFGAFAAIIAAVALLWALGGAAAGVILALIVVGVLVAGFVWFWRGMDRGSS